MSILQKKKQCLSGLGSWILDSSPILYKINVTKNKHLSSSELALDPARHRQRPTPNQSGPSHTGLVLATQRRLAPFLDAERISFPGQNPPLPKGPDCCDTKASFLIQT